MAVIFYMSATGNTYDAAKQIASAMPNTRIESIASYLKAPYNVQDEVVGIAGPTYCFDLAPYVQDFIKVVKIKPQYLFGIVTMGDNQGNSLKTMQDLLAERGMTLNYGAAIAMPDNYFINGSQTKFAEKLRNADKKLERVVMHIIDRRNDTSECEAHGFWKHVGTPVGWWVMKNVMGNGTFRVDATKCIGCRSCARLCPVQNITMDNGLPKFSDKCAMCLACVRWCPKHAIKMGGVKDSSKKNYTNPNVKINELFNN